MGIKYPFVRTCTDEKQADYKIAAIKEEYKNRPDWIIGDIKKEPLPTGEVKITVELTKLSNEEIKEKNSGFGPRF